MRSLADGRPDVSVAVPNLRLPARRSANGRNYGGLDGRYTRLNHWRYRWTANCRDVKRGSTYLLLATVNEYATALG